MKKNYKVFFYSIIITFLCLVGFNSVTAQTVTNVRFSQEGDNVRITYDLSDPADITVEMSTDGGVTFSSRLLVHLSGDVGRNVSAGKNKSVLWNVLADVDNLEGDDIRFRVVPTRIAPKTVQSSAYQPKPRRIKKDTTWYNNIRFNIGKGQYGTIKRIGYSNNSSINISSKETTYEGFTVMFGFQRLKKNGQFYYGPGFNISFIGIFIKGISQSYDIYLHGMVELAKNQTFLGFDNIHPYAAASAGIGYRTKYIYGEHLSTYSYGTNLEWRWNSWGKDTELKNIKPYVDYSLGITINLGKYSALNIGYHGVLVAGFLGTLDVNDHLSELQSIIQTGDGHDHKFYPEYKTAYFLQHGFELSFRF